MQKMFSETWFGRLDASVLAHYSGLKVFIYCFTFMYINPADIARDAALAARGLPEIAYVDHTWDKSPTAAPVLAVKRGESGFYPIRTTLTADELNEKAGVTEFQREAMQLGSMMGWDAPGAHPALHERIAQGRHGA